MRRLFLIVPILATIALFAALVPAAGTAQEDPPVYWESIDVITDVQENGDMLVTETQTYQFTRPHTTQRYRYIPLGLVESIDAVSVWQDGEKISGVHSGIEDGQQWIRWSHRPLDPPETLTFVLRYRVRGGLRLDADGDQVYWKALFKDRDTDIRTGSVTVRLPESLSGRIEDYRSFGSSAGSRQVDPRTVVFRTSGPLPPGKELEVQVTFPHGLLDVPTPEWQQRHFLGAGGLLGLGWPGHVHRPRVPVGFSPVAQFSGMAEGQLSRAGRTGNPAAQRPFGGGGIRPGLPRGHPSDAARNNCRDVPERRPSNRRCRRW